MRAASPLSLVRTRLGQRLCIGAFVACLVIPMLAQVFAAATDLDVAAIEMRAPAAFPDKPASAAELAAWPGRFEAWLNDRFALRGHFVLLNSLVQVKLLRQSPSKVVALGPDDWLFYVADRVGASAKLGNHFPVEDADRWIDLMERRRDWLEARGIPFLVVAVPNKERIYAELLPKAYRALRPETRFDQIKTRLAERGSTLDLLDLTPGLLAAKDRGKVYLKADTHWTRATAFAFGYRPVAERIAARLPAFVPLPDDAVETRDEMRPGEALDLARMIGLAAISSEPERVTRLRDDGGVRQEETVKDGITTTRFTRAQPGPKLVWYRDSFSLTLYPFVAASVGEVVFTEHRFFGFDPELITRERPDLVVYQFNERFLSAPVAPRDDVRATLAVP